MMKTIDYLIPTPGTSSTTFYLPFKDPSRLVSMYVSAGAAQSSGTVSIEDGDSNTIMEADLSDIDSAGDVVKGAWDSSASEVQKSTIFDKDNPLVLKIDLQADTNVGLQIVVDPFLIGAHEGLSS